MNRPNDPNPNPIWKSSASTSHSGSRVPDRIELGAIDPSIFAGKSELDGRSLNAETFLRTAAMIQERWLTGVIAFSLVFAPIVAHTIFVVPDYVAKGTVQVAAEDAFQTNTALKELLGGGVSNMETEVEIIRRNDFLLTVAKKLYLHVQDPLQPKRYTDDLGITLGSKSPVRHELYTMRNALTMAELDSSYSGIFHLELRANDAGELEVRSPDAEEFKRWLPISLQVPHAIGPLTIQFDRPPVEAGTQETFLVLGDAALVNRVVDRVEVLAIGSSRNPTNLVEVSFVDPDRHLARNFVRSILENYVEQSLAWKTESADKALALLQDEFNKTQETLSKRENQLEDFAKSSKAVQIDEQARQTIDEIAVLETELRKVDVELTMTNSVLSSIRSGKKGQIGQSLSTFSQDPVIQASIQKLVDAETELSLLGVSITKDHPRLLELREQVRERQQELERMVRASLRTLKEKQRKLAQKKGQARARLSSFPEQQVELSRRNREVQDSERLHSELSAQLENAKLRRKAATTDKRIVDRPFLPDSPSHPKRALILAVGAVASALFAIIVVFVSHALRRKIRTNRELRERVPFPVFGIIPENHRLARNSASAQLDADTTEAFRSLAIRVGMARRQSERGQVVMVTSAMAQEGRSLVAAQVAHAAARTGAKVLILDLDLRDPSQHRLALSERAPGYVDWQNEGGEIDRLDAFIRHLEDNDVDLLTAGTAVSDAAATLDLRKLSTALGDLVTRYDQIFIDAPTTPAADVQLLAYIADLTLLVSQPGKINRRELRQAVSAIARQPGTAGLVMTKTTRASSRHDYLDDDEPIHGGGFDRPGSAFPLGGSSSAQG